MNFWPKDTGEGEKAMLRIIEEMSRSEMNYVAQMLMQEVTPLEPTLGRTKRPNTWSDPAIALQVRMRSSLERYRVGVTTEWSNAATISMRMGVCRNTIFKQLMALTDRGVLEKRPAGGDGKFNRRKGWEWRWAE